MNAPTRSRRDFLAAAAQVAGGSTLLWARRRRDCWRRIAAGARARRRAGRTALRAALSQRLRSHRARGSDRRVAAAYPLRRARRPEEGGSVIGRSYRRMVEMAEKIGAKLETPAMGHGPKTGAARRVMPRARCPTVVRTGLADRLA